MPAGGHLIIGPNRDISPISRLTSRCLVCRPSHLCVVCVCRVGTPPARWVDHALHEFIPRSALSHHHQHLSGAVSARPTYCAIACRVLLSPGCIDLTPPLPFPTRRGGGRGVAETEVRRGTQTKKQLTKV